MAGRLSSPRFRRRALKLSGLAAVAAAAAVIAVLFWNTGHTYDSPVRPNEPAVVPQARHSVSLSEAERRQALDTAARFVRTAVRREHTADSFDLVSTQLRSGLSRAEWAKGDIPVQPYPVDAARWKMDYAYEDEIGLSVYVIPRAGRRLSPMVFLLSLTRERPSGQWLVDSWVPRPGTIDNAPPTAQSWSSAAAPAAASAPSGRISGVWLAVPFALLLSGMAFGVFHLARERRAAARAERAYREERSSSSSSPS